MRTTKKAASPTWTACPTRSAATPTTIPRRKAAKSSSPSAWTRSGESAHRNAARSRSNSPESCGGTIGTHFSSVHYGRARAINRNRLHSAKPPLAPAKLAKRRLQVERPEIRPHAVCKHQLGIRRLPQKKIREPLLAARADEQIHLAPLSRKHLMNHLCYAFMRQTVIAVHRMRCCQRSPRNRIARR